MGQRRVSVACAFAALAASFVLSASTATAAKLPTTPCELPDVARPVRCGVLDVLEDPDQPDGRRLPIHVAVVPATSGRALSDPIYEKSKRRCARARSNERGNERHASVGPYIELGQRVWAGGVPNGRERKRCCLP
jgi:hypothetical protein